LDLTVTGIWRKPQNEKVHNWYSSRNIVRVIKSKDERAGHVAGIVAMRSTCNSVVKEEEGNRSLEEVDVDGRIILK
jgi:hypothetical protein